MSQYSSSSLRCGVLVDIGGKKVGTHGVETLDVGDVGGDGEMELVGESI